MIKLLRLKETRFGDRIMPCRKATMGVLLLLLCTIFQVQAQTRTISGIVRSSDDNNALPGANVVIKGTSTGTVTGADGSYRINASDQDVLVFSFVGYASSEVTVGANTNLDIQLAPDVNALEEVVVVGYGVVKKSDLTGSVSLVDSKELAKIVSNDVTQQMQGRVAGVAINSDGQPGASPQVKIRGISTFGVGGTDSQPLYVVDGMPLGGTVNGGDAFQPNNSVSPIRDINPNDIESIQVLKDASAGAIYGVRAANGVVIITTKRGRLNQGVKIDVGTYAGVQEVARTIPVLNREQFQMINRETFVNGGQNASPPIPPGNFPGSPDFIDDIDTDWQKEGLKKGGLQNYNVGITGGTASTAYFAGIDFFKNTGTMVGNGPNYQRYSVRLNSDTRKGNFRFGQNMYVSRSDENPGLRVSGTPGANPPFINDLIWGNPTIPILDPNREGGFGGSSAIENALSLNIIGLNRMVETNKSIFRTLAGVYGEYDFVPGLTYRLSMQYDYSQTHEDLFVPMYDLGFFFENGIAFLNRSSNNYTSGLVENTLKYVKTYGRNNLNVLAGVTYQDFETGIMNARTTGLQKPYVKTLSNGIGTKTISEYQERSSLFSLLARLDYNYDDRYFITANVRRDGSSKFPESNRYVVFPSVAMAWKMHNDITMPAFITELKVRGGIGRLGNQSIPPYGFQAPLNSNITYAFNDARVFGSAAVATVDPNLRWEVRTTRNIGADIKLGEALEFTVEYYSNLAEDIIVPVPLPLSVGANPASLLTNGGSMKNTGIEFSLNYVKQVNDFYFEMSPNFYTLKNEVLAIGQDGQNLTDQNSRTEVGGALGRHYGWVTEGIFQTTAEVGAHAFQSAGTGPGDMIFKDLNNDNVINDLDRTFIGDAIPTFYYGLNFTAEYKGIDFTVFGSGSSGAVAVNNMYRALMSSQASGNTNFHEDVLERWTPENTGTEVPRQMYLDPNQNGRPSDRFGWLQSTAYFRLNTLSVGYSLPATFLSKIKMGKVRIYATAQNLATITKYKGFNPDFQGISALAPGFDFGTYPRPRTLMAGVQLSF
jgi:TonB-linked SusC/RagA family outer membrane protein